MASSGMARKAIAAILVAWAVSVSAENVPQQQAPLVDTLPSAQEFYYPLMADPTELGFSGRYFHQTGGADFSEVSLGDYLGVLRLRLPANWVMQLNVGGGVLARFDMSSVRNALEVADYTACLPLDIHRGAHTIRMGYWHTSSHLGDDFIKDNPGFVLQKRTTDSMKATYSYTPTDWVRAYGGGSYAFNAVNVGGRSILQGGLELLSPYFGGHSAQLFLAQDFQSLQRVHWNPAYTVRAGVRATNSRHYGAARLFVEYFTDHYYFLQLYEHSESHVGIGLSLEIGNPTK